MNQQPELCSDERLRSLLQVPPDDDSDEVQASAQHIDQCPHCQARLEQLAAEPTEWRDVRDSLVTGIDSGGIGEDTIDNQPRAWSRWQRRLPAWSESMSRQLLSPPSHPEMLGRIGRYEVERLIGTGGMGVVFKAFDTELNRPVAVKVLAPFLAGSGAARKRFAREARAAAAVVHEHVVSIHNVESDGASPFLVMHYVAGESLQCRIDREGPLDVCEILRIGMQTAAGLAAAHAQGLVHRDVKPSNILLEKGVERALLTDFGLARANDDASLTHTGYHPGTPQYMSPEQARGDSVDPRSDLFSLGSVLYAMCTGRPPFRAESSYGILRRITDTQSRSIREINPRIPLWLESIVGKLHAKEPQHRFSSANEVHTLLEKCLAHVQQPATAPLPAGCRTEPWFRQPKSLRIGRTLARRMVFASILVAGAAVILAGRHYLVDRPKQESSQMNTEAAPPIPITSNRPNDDPTTAWDADSIDIDAYRQDLTPFENRTDTLWDATLPPEQEK